MSKAVPHQNIVLHELTEYLPWGGHDRLVEEHGGEAHLTGMLYGQFANAQSLPEIEAALRSHAGKLYRLGRTCKGGRHDKAKACRTAVHRVRP